MTKNQIEWERLQEEKRHNVVSETFTGADVAEKVRHNQATETLSAQSILNDSRKLDETIRHNQMTEGLTQQAQDEQVRHNLASEQLTSSSISASYYGSGVGYVNAAEAQRHNLAVEAETQRHNEETEDTARVTAGSKLINDIAGFFRTTVPIISSFTGG